jgi:hypothetical protein
MMGTIRTAGLLAASAITLAACSGSSTSSSVTADQAAGNAAGALCQKYDSCSAFFVQIAYGDVDACTAALKTTLASALAASGTGATPTQVAACATAVGTASCDQVLSHDLPSPCQPVAGQLAAGAACGDSSQCQSAYCHKGSGSTCGACAGAPSPGVACGADDDCPAGNVCTKQSTCAPPGAAGASCDPVQRPCKATLACKSGTCANPDPAGAPCTRTTTGATSTDTCDALAGLYCNAQGTCAKIGLAAAGQACLLVNGSLAACSANGTCNVPTMLSTSGTCLGAAAPGASCTAKGTGISYAVKSPDCAPPATCDNGVCTIPDAARCH